MKQRPDGRYRCRYKRYDFYGDTEKEALDKRRDFLKQLEQGIREEQIGLTVRAYADRWLPAYRGESSKKAYSQYTNALDRLCSRIGTKRMADVTPTDIKLFYSTLAGMSSSYINKHVMTVKALFSSAVDDGIIMRTPCTANVKPPDGTTGTHRVLTAEEIAIVHKLADHRFTPYVMLMLYEGLRRGEALALDFTRDVDLANNRIFVRESIAFDDVNKGTRKGPKSACGERSIPIFPPLREMLNSQTVTPTIAKNGVPTHQAFVRAWESWKSAFEEILNGDTKRWYGRRAGDRDKPPWRECTIRTHDFRHTFCTMLYDAGVDIKTAMLWMGHADQAMILHIYAHLSDERKKTAEDAASAVMKSVVERATGGQFGGQDS